MTLTRRLLLAVAIVAAGGTQTLAASGKRVALVMGNSAYVNISPLEKPIAEARELAALLRRIGFQVIVGTNLSKRGMEQLVQDFRAVLEDADFGFFHFSGHGFQSGMWGGKRTNHLVPVDFEFPAADGAFETVTLDGIVDLLKQVRVGVITLDACRNDPELTVASVLGDTKSVKISRGFSAVHLNDTASGSSTTPPQPGRSWVGRGPSGLVVAYATDPGNVAFEGSKGHFSPYTTALIEHLPTPGLSLAELLGRISDQVSNETNGKQTPWSALSRTVGAYVLVPKSKPTARSPQRSNR